MGDMPRKKDILSMTQTEIESFLIQIGEPKYRGAQIFSWLHNKRAVSFSDMTNLPMKLRVYLSENAAVNGCVIDKTHNADDGAIKYRMSVSDGFIETVYIPHNYGAGLCVSSQLGCGYGCAFCASATGFKRNLTAGEMLSQVYETERIHGALGSVVVMGTGEPLDNYSELIRFLTLLNTENGRNMSIRSVTVSTCGISAGIRKLANDKPGTGLAISLHATDDSTRLRLMPRAGKTSIASLLSAADYFFETTGRRVTWEYLLLSGINDTVKDQNALIKLLKGKNTHVNLLPYNSTGADKKSFSASNREKDFLAALTGGGLNATLRKSMGGSVKGACGQLTRGY